MPLPALLIAAIPAIAAGIQSMINSNQADTNQNKTIGANKELAEYQYSKDLEMWNKNNQYNTPEQQMARLKTAGLNPNLVYGTGAVGNTSAQIPKYQAPTVKYDKPSPVDLPQMLGSYQNTQMIQAQLNNVNANTENTKQRTLNEVQREVLLQMEKTTGQNKQDNQRLVNSMLQNNLTRMSELFPSQLDASRLNVEQIKLNNKLKMGQLGMQPTQLQGMQKNLDRQDIENAFNKMRNELMKGGQNPNSSTTERMVIEFLRSIGIDPNNLLKK